MVLLLNIIPVFAILQLWCASVFAEPGLDMQKALQSLITTYAPEFLEENNMPDEDTIFETIRSRAYGQDAVTVTTPEICYESHICGFQMYEDYTRKHIDEFIKYCNCREGYECIPVGENLKQRVFIHGCVKIGAPRKTTPMVSVARSTSEARTTVLEERTKAMESTTAIPPADISDSKKRDTEVLSDGDSSAEALDKVNVGEPVKLMESATAVPAAHINEDKELGTEDSVPSIKEAGLSSEHEEL